MTKQRTTIIRLSIVTATTEDEPTSNRDQVIQRTTECEIEQAKKLHPATRLRVVK